MECLFAFLGREGGEVIAYSEEGTYSRKYGIGIYIFVAIKMFIQ